MRVNKWKWRVRMSDRVAHAVLVNGINPDYLAYAEVDWKDEGKKIRYVTRGDHWKFVPSIRK